MIIAESAKVQIRELATSDFPALSEVHGDRSVMEFSSKGAQWALIERHSSKHD